MHQKETMTEPETLDCGAAHLTVLMLPASGQSRNEPSLIATHCPRPLGAGNDCRNDRS
ncbi:hypothetical protein MchiMG62_14600 [Methanoculleus chikugoensis]|uniref:Uncharacterized protein n=1 Tax=Methanoculleus chikugoensis TaxID=118126 RepID=A0ABM7H636_9EURY|nr:hypothetical protein MchiMG62_14600 [Methanoculleus chikugoensis]